MTAPSNETHKVQVDHLPKLRRVQNDISESSAEGTYDVPFTT